MTCDAHAHVLVDYLYGELSPLEAERFLDHARGCDACRAELDSLTLVRRAETRAAPLPDPPEALTARILDAARQAQAGARTGEGEAGASAWWSWLVRPWTLGLAAAGAGVAAVLLVGTPSLWVLKSEAGGAPPVSVSVAAPPPPVSARVAPGDVADPGAERWEEAPRAAALEERVVPGRPPAMAKPSVKVERSPAKESSGRAGAVPPGEDEDGAKGGVGGAVASTTWERALRDRVAGEGVRAESPKSRKAQPPADSSPLILPARPVEADMDTGANQAAAGPVAQPPVAETAAVAPPAAAEPIPVQGLKKDAVVDGPERQALARARADFKRSDGEARARAELEAATELLATGKVEESLALFRRAERLDAARQLAPNPRAGQVSALSRLGQCAEAHRLAQGISQAHPGFAGQPRLVREVADCLVAAGDTVKAKEVRAGASKSAAGVGVPAAERQAQAARLLAGQAVGVARCEQVATGQGELPAAAGAWDVNFVVDPDGKGSGAVATGPGSAPLLQNCLEALAQGLDYGQAEGPSRAVTVRLTIQARPPPKAR